MIRRIPLIGDQHATENGFDKPYKIVKDFLSSYKWDNIVLGGDYSNFDSLSHWLRDKRKKREIEGKRYQKECEVLNKDLDFLEKQVKQGRDIIYLRGNHERFITDYINEHPQVEGILDLDKMLHIDKRNVEMIPYNLPYKIGNIWGIHGAYSNKYHAEKHYRKYGCNLFYFHNHQAQTYQANQKMINPVQTWGIGCLCKLDPDYMRRKPTNHMNQFGILEMNDKTGNFSLNTITIINNKFIWNGKEYK